MSYETVEVLRDGGVATLWMNRPEVHNAFNAQLIADLSAACRALDADAALPVEPGQGVHPVDHAAPGAHRHTGHRPRRRQRAQTRWRRPPALKPAARTSKPQDLFQSIPDMNTLKFIAACAMLASAGASFGHTSAPHEGDGNKANDSAPAEKEQMPWGIAGDAKAVQRTLTLRMDDAMRFTPNHIEVREGDKFDALTRIIDVEPEFYGIVFSRTRTGADDIVAKLN